MENASLTDMTFGLN